MLFHSFVFTGHMGDDPVFVATGTTIRASSASAVFFVLSGFLVTRAGSPGPDSSRSHAARALRIYPALFVCGGAVDSLCRRVERSSVADVHRLAGDFRLRMAQCACVGSALHASRGVSRQSISQAVNGSLWTLPVELRLYIAVAIAGMAGLLARTDRCAGALLALVALFAWKPEWLPLEPHTASVRNLALLFGLGSLAYVARDRVPLSLAAFLIGVAIVVANPGDGAAALVHVTIAYGTLVLAYHPRSRWRAYNRVGDYRTGSTSMRSRCSRRSSLRFQGFAPMEFFAISSAVTLALAAISWHALERPALAFKSHFRGRSTEALSTRDAKA
jgi:peptidoglycan/LPS O-acetylase OafA/YrhL